tara:strand:- start:1871 stop:2620 length:750 start_codon:yes stop_codon:yes gene_type:complete
MLPTQLIKKGCIVSFISLLLLTAVLYFVVYKTLVVESFGSLNQIGEALVDSDMSGKDKALYAHYFTKRTADQADDDTTPCGPDKDAVTENELLYGIAYTSQTRDEDNVCAKNATEDSCIKTVRIKQKMKAKDDGCFGDEGALFSGDRLDICPSPAVNAEGVELEERAGKPATKDEDYKIRYNVYPCTWTGSKCDQDSQACGVVSDSGYAYRVNNVPDGLLPSSNEDWTPDTTADVESQRLSFLDAHTQP